MQQEGVSNNRYSYRNNRFHGFHGLFKFLIISMTLIRKIREIRCCFFLKRTPVIVRWVEKMNYFTTFSVTVLPFFNFITFRTTPFAWLPTSMPAVLK